MNAILFILVVLVSLTIIQHVIIQDKFASANSSQKSDPKKLSKDSSRPFVNKAFEADISKYFTKDKDLVKINSTSIFSTWIKNNDYQMVNGKKIWNKVIFKIDPLRNYNDIKNNGKTVVVFPIFTDTAYAEPGFYTYYREECDRKCLTVRIQNNFSPAANPSAVQVLKLLGYSFITDIDVDKNPSVLDKYDKVIILHNEYVTKKEFRAITAHPNVIYLYPNALYAEIKVDYTKNTITLVRGHNYPKPEIRNGFEWKFDNSQFEYDNNCKKMQFYKVDNGWMLNCYPENAIHKNMKLLEVIKKL